MKKTNSFNAISRPANFAVSTCFTLYALVCVLPLLLLIAVSLTSQPDIYADGYSFFPRAFTLQAYEFLLKDLQLIGRSYMITIGVAVCGVVINVMISSMYAFAISRPEYDLRRLFVTIVVITMVFSGGIPPLYYMYAGVLKIKNTLLALLLPGLCNGFYIIVMRTFFVQSIPNEIVESARIDGSSETNTFYKIVLPISTPILATVAIFTALFYWNDFFNSMLFIENPKLFNLQYTMQRAILNLEFIRTQLANSSAASQIAVSSARDMPLESVRMAMVVLGIGPIVLVYPFFQRYFVRGLTIGAVKG